MTSIHPTAIVDAKAELADSVEVGPYSVIGPEVQIGANTRIGPHVVVRGPTVLGEENQIYQFASVGEDPQDISFKGEQVRLEVGDRNVIREFCTFNRGTMKDEGVTKVGNDNLFMAYVHLAHDCVVGNHSILANNGSLAGHVVVGDWVILGGFAKVHQFCRLGDHSFLAGDCVARHDVPPYVTVADVPATPKGINVTGLKRRGFTAEQIRNIRNAYKLIYRSNLLLDEAADKLANLADSQPEVKIMADFLARKGRGIAR